MTYNHTEQSRNKLTAMSRYRSSRIITDSETKTKFLETYKKASITKSLDDFYHTVKPEEENRLDLISYRYYQSPLLWWVIASVNDITDPLQSPAVGDILRVPSITSLYGNEGLLL